MKLQIFDVEHGSCALLTCINGTKLMIDCGHNSNSDWKPGSYLRTQGITYLDTLALYFALFPDENVHTIRNF